MRLRVFSVFGLENERSKDEWRWFSKIESERDFVWSEKNGYM